MRCRKRVSSPALDNWKVIFRERYLRLHLMTAKERREVVSKVAYLPAVRLDTQDGIMLSFGGVSPPVPYCNLPSLQSLLSFANLGYWDLHYYYYYYY